MVASLYKKETIENWIADYNKLLDKELIATAWMADPNHSDEQKKEVFLRYKCEIIDAIGSYYNFFLSIGIAAQPFERIRYFSEKTI